MRKIMSRAGSVGNYFIQARAFALDNLCTVTISLSFYILKIYFIVLRDYPDIINLDLQSGVATH